MTKYYGIYMALLNGWLGATASCFGKIAFDPNSIITDSNSTIYWFWNSLSTAFCPTITKATGFMVGQVDDNNDAPLLNSTTTLSLFLSCTFFIQQGIPRLLCFLCMLLLNAGMLSTFLIALEYSGSVAGTAVCSASNMIMSAVYGYLFFHDSIASIQWWFGFTFILMGVAILSSVQIVVVEKQQETTIATTTTKCIKNVDVDVRQSNMLHKPSSNIRQKED